jgi:hypothetical protein
MGDLKMKIIYNACADEKSSIDEHDNDITGTAPVLLRPTSPGVR